MPTGRNPESLNQTVVGSFYRKVRKSKNLAISQLPKAAAESVEIVVARFDLLGRGRMRQLDRWLARSWLEFLGVIEIRRAAAEARCDEGAYTALFAGKRWIRL